MGKEGRNVMYLSTLCWEGMEWLSPCCWTDDMLGNVNKFSSLSTENNAILQLLI
jgi:hypothetical protein